MKQQMLKAVPGVIALAMTLYTLIGCRHTTGKSSSAQPISRAGIPVDSAPGPNNFQIVVHGGALTAVNATSIEVISPWDENHQVVIGDKSTPAVPARYGSCNITIEIELQNLTGAHGSPNPNPAFDRVKFVQPAWRRMGSPQNYLVILKVNALPVSIEPEKETARGKLLARFTNDPGGVPVPEGQLVSFNPPGPNGVVVKRTETRNCDNPKDDTRKETIETPKGNTYFVGVGLPAEFPGASAEHGKDFYNKKLLCEVYGSCGAVPDEKKIISTAHEHELTHARHQWPAPHIVHAAFTNTSLTMLATENCSIPTVLVTRQ